MLFGREDLIAEKHHFVLVPQLGDAFESGVVQGLRQIDAGDFRAKCCAGGANVHQGNLSCAGQKLK